MRSTHEPRSARSCQPIERAFGQADVSSERKSVNLRSPRSAYSLATLYEPFRPHLSQATPRRGPGISDSVIEPDRGMSLS
jgi:hypothetical protein